MRFPRKLALGLAALVTTLLVALLVVPFLFRDRIAARLKSEVNASVNARVAWSGASLGLLRDFPNVTLGLDRFSVVGVEPFAGDTLVSMRQARLVLDLGSVVGYLRTGAPIVVREIVLGRPVVRLRVLPDGRSNWDIARARAAATPGEGKAVGVTLRALRITDGSVTFDDQQSHLVASVEGLQESLRGDFAQQRFVLTTRTRADSVSLRFAGIPYLNRVGVELNADVDADLAAHRFSFRNDSLRLNQLVLAFAGSVTTGKPDMILDVTFATPSTKFADILSLVPVIYARDFEKLQTAGTMSTSGRVHGSYGPHAFPALALRARVENGAFRYPSLPLPAREIFLDLAIDNPGGHVDSTVVNLKRFHAAIGGRPLDARLTMRTPVSDPDVDLRLVGSVDLADVGKTVKLESVKELAGTVAADIAMRARLSDVDAGRYDKVAAAGTVNAAHVALRSATIPHPIAVDTMALRFTPRTTELTSLAARIGHSDVRAVGSLDNLLGFALRDQDLRGSATVNSDHFDLNEWRSNEKTTEVIPVPPHVDFALKASAAKVTYAALTAANVQGDLRVKDQRVTLNELRMETLRGSVIANGYYETSVPGRPTFDFDLRLAAVDIPSAFTALTTVQKLAPIARWAQGGLSGTIGLKGPLGTDMTPVFTALTGKGAIETDRLVVQGAPLLDKLADAVKLDQLRKPSLGVVKASFDVADGRVSVKPFVVQVGGIGMTVAGSNGIDQSLKYDLSLAVPRTALGAAGTGMVTKLASQAGKAGELGAGDAVQLGAQVTGTVTNPSVKPSFAGMSASVRDAAASAVRQEVATRTAAVKQKADSAAEQARARARAEAERLVSEAERQAAAIRADARTLAEKARTEGRARADSLMARATNPAARMAAQVGTDRIRREADQQADRIVREADARADALVAQAKRQADALTAAKG
ncbi:MAG TPA: AsmA-like C-terminal region-containing protein [Gemmatimonadaceae bacterium]|nr:AsmA-like C-terminal region-containing protein [Gemmatimonadaceae bacterium]